MKLKETIENNIIVILVGTVLATAGVVSGVTSFFYNSATESLETQHGIELSSASEEHKRNLAKFETEISDLKSKNEMQKEETEKIKVSLERIKLKENFLSIHTRAVTMAAVHNKNVFPHYYLAENTDWDVENTIKEYDATIDHLRRLNSDVASVKVSRAGPSLVRFDDGTSWPTIDMSWLRKP